MYIVWAVIDIHPSLQRGAYSDCLFLCALQICIYITLHFTHEMWQPQRFFHVKITRNPYTTRALTELRLTTEPRMTADVRNAFQFLKLLDLASHVQTRAHTQHNSYFCHRYPSNPLYRVRAPSPVESTPLKNKLNCISQTFSNNLNSSVKN